ncbi:MAG: beta-ketoacyl-ACP synthase [Gammaproteobacteria bacterium]|nr:beta-ketoacyl-ACP synthase [Gammaproteobacteria bacterium]MDH3749066.1 beta-ketoacyl-ACP synthase [Gammaproteobacteria bacterium]
MRLAIGSYTATSAAGVGLAAMQKSIAGRSSGLRPNDLDGCDLDTWIGRVDALEAISLPRHLAHLSSRDNQLAWLGLQQDGLLDSLAQLTKRISADRVGVIIGTSTSSIGRTEEAYTKLLPSGFISEEYRQPEVHSLHSPGAFVSAATGLEGPSMTISTACSSSAKVFASAARWISHGLVDAVLVGGIDGLCMSILYGFNSLELVSSSLCRPFDRRRDGINIGEGCGYAILMREELQPDSEFALLGYGESSDAYHMSHPHPEGKGAVTAIDQALERAQVPADAIDYVNLHGTASQANDRIEAYALAQRFSEHTLASSTKAWTGHALGAAGILEAVITLQAMRHGLIPGTLNCEEQDPDAAFGVLTENSHKPISNAMTNSFGFGGNNAVLIFGRTND